MDARRLGAGMYDPGRGDEPVGTRAIRAPVGPHEPARTNRFAVYRLDAGAGNVAVDAARHAFGPGAMLFLAPYRRVRFDADAPLVGEVIEFHANFLCVETFHAEVGCAGVLFNDPYGVPSLTLDGPTAAEVRELFARISSELERRGLAYQEVALAYLKVLLVVASRIKSGGGGACGASDAARRHPLLVRLGELIEAHYRESRSPADYADALHVTPKSLGRLVREHLGTTITELVRDRVLIHAKWQLLHTLRPVKEIAREVGFADELYFSRLFRRAVGLSPTAFREFETEIRGGSNLSMTSGPPSIPAPPSSPDNPLEAGGDGGREAAARTARGRKSGR